MHLQFSRKFHNLTAQSHEFDGVLLQLIEQRHRLFLGEMQPQFLHDLVVIRTHGAELRVKIRQLGVVVHQRLVHLQHLELLPEEVRFKEYGLGVNTGFPEHG